MTYTLALVIEDASLRSMLVGRLTLGGADLVTASDLYDRRITSKKNNTLFLITDDATLAKVQGGLEDLFADPRWSRVAIVGGTIDAPVADHRVVRLHPASAAKELMAMLA